MNDSPAKSPVTSPGVEMSSPLARAALHPIHLPTINESTELPSIHDESPNNRIMADLSPTPPNNRIMAGHTPLRTPRRPTPPPAYCMDGLEDTPTRNNTHINTLLSTSHCKDEDEALKGPLNMPELPHQPDESNFTLEALSRKLALIERDPESSESRPMVFAQPSPGLASPANEVASRTGSLVMSPGGSRSR